MLIFNCVHSFDQKNYNLRNFSYSILDLHLSLMNRLVWQPPFCCMCGRSVSACTWPCIGSCARSAPPSCARCCCPPTMSTALIIALLGPRVFIHFLFASLLNCFASPSCAKGLCCLFPLSLSVR